jgi:hypothetical protein
LFFLFKAISRIEMKNWWHARTFLSATFIIYLLTFSWWTNSLSKIGWSKNTLCFTCLFVYFFFFLFLVSNEYLIRFLKIEKCCENRNIFIIENSNEKLKSCIQLSMCMQGYTQDSGIKYKGICKWIFFLPLAWIFEKTIYISITVSWGSEPLPSDFV